MSKREYNRKLHTIDIKPATKVALLKELEPYLPCQVKTNTNSSTFFTSKQATNLAAELTNFLNQEDKLHIIKEKINSYKSICNADVFEGCLNNILEIIENETQALENAVKTELFSISKSL